MYFMSLDELAPVLLTSSSCASNLGSTFIAVRHTAMSLCSLRPSPILLTPHCLVLRTSLFFCLFLAEDSYSCLSLKTFISKSLIRAIRNDTKKSGGMKSKIKQKTLYLKNSCIIRIPLTNGIGKIWKSTKAFLIPINPISRCWQ